MTNQQHPLTPHRATAEQWQSLENDDTMFAYEACILELRARVEAVEVRDREDSDAWTGVRRANSELRARVEALEGRYATTMAALIQAQQERKGHLQRIEALEAGATCPHVVSSDEGTSYCGLAEQQAARRPKPPTLAEEALELVALIQGNKKMWQIEQLDVVRRALERLQQLEDQQ